IKLLKTWAVANGVSLWDAMKQSASVSGVSARAQNALRQFVAMVELWRNSQAASPPPAMPETLELSQATELVKGRVTRLMEDVVRRSGLEASLRKEDADDGDDPMANVNELISSAAEYDAGNPDATLDEYLSMI